MAANKSIINLMRKLPSVQALRSLYDAQALGIPSYQEARANTANQYSADVIVNRFKGRMTEYTKPEAKGLIFVDDLKTLIHVATDSDADLELVQNAFKRFRNQKQQGDFHFGPVMMRYYYLMGKPVEALKAFCDPGLDGMFDDFSSFKTLMGLLYQYNMHDELLAVFDVLKVKKVKEPKSIQNSMIYVIASCYKKNTPESYKLVTDLCKDFSQEVTRKAAVVAAALALKQNDPNYALELIQSVTFDQPSLAYRNIKVLAFSQIDRPEEAITLLKRCLFRSIRIKILPEVLEALKQSVDRVKEENLKDILISEIKTLEVDLKEGNSIFEGTMDELVLTPIRAIKSTERDGERNQRRNQGRPQKRDTGSDSDSD